MTKQRKVYLVLAGVWLLAGIVNLLTDASKASIIYDIFAVVLFLLLFFAERRWGNKGAEGKKKLKWVYGSVIAALVVFLIIVIIL